MGTVRKDDQEKGGERVFGETAARKGRVVRKTRVNDLVPFLNIASFVVLLGCSGGMNAAVPPGAVPAFSLTGSIPRTIFTVL